MLSNNTDIIIDCIVECIQQYIYAFITLKQLLLNIHISKI